MDSLPVVQTAHRSLFTKKRALPNPQKVPQAKKKCPQSTPKMLTSGRLCQKGGEKGGEKGGSTIECQFSGYLDLAHFW